MTVIIGILFISCMVFGVVMGFLALKGVDDEEDFDNNDIA